MVVLLFLDTIQQLLHVEGMRRGLGARLPLSSRPGLSLASFFESSPLGATLLMAKGAASAVAAFERDPSGPVLLPRHVALDWICEFIVNSRPRSVFSYVFARPAHFCCFVSLTVRTLSLLA